MISGAAAEASAALVRNPFEVVKQNMQLGKYASIIESCGDIFAKKGVRGFYVGYFSLILREMPFSMIQMPLYEILKMF